MKPIVKGSREYWERNWNDKTSSRPKKETQKQMILNALKSGASLTQLDVYEYPYRCKRLAAVVNVLRNEGHNIITKHIKNGKGKTYGEYRLIPSIKDWAE